MENKGQKSFSSRENLWRKWTMAASPKAQEHSLNTGHHPSTTFLPFPFFVGYTHTWLMCFSLSIIWLTTGSGPFIFSSCRLNWFFIPFLAAFWLYLGNTKVKKRFVTREFQAKCKLTVFGTNGQADRKLSSAFQPMGWLHGTTHG